MKMLDITKEHCPMTFVKVRLALSSMAPGEQIDVLLTGDEPYKNVPKSAKEFGHKVLSVTQDGENYHVLIEK